MSVECVTKQSSALLLFRDTAGKYRERTLEPLRGSGGESFFSFLVFSFSRFLVSIVCCCCCFGLE